MCPGPFFVVPENHVLMRFFQALHNHRMAFWYPRHFPDVPLPLDDPELVPQDDDKLPLDALEEELLKKVLAEATLNTSGGNCSASGHLSLFKNGSPFP